MLSPTRVSPRTVSTIAIPGKTPVHQIPDEVSASALLRSNPPIQRLMWLDAEAKEAQAGERQDRLGSVQGEH